VKRIASDGVTLEPRSMAHAEELYGILCEPGLYEFLDEEPPPSVESLRQKLARSESRKSPDGSEHWLNWIVRDELGRVAGYVQATVFPDGEANIAYVLGSSHWGRGLAYRAVDEMLRIVSVEFGVNAFHVRAERANLRSVRLAERLGFSAATPEESARKGIPPGEILLRKFGA
jgi:RimJ/RimL family protein N-acetyltransferase